MAKTGQWAKNDYANNNYIDPFKDIERVTPLNSVALAKLKVEAAQNTFTGQLTSKYDDTFVHDVTWVDLNSSGLVDDGDRFQIDEDVFVIGENGASRDDFDDQADLVEAYYKNAISGMYEFLRVTDQIRRGTRPAPSAEGWGQIMSSPGSWSSNYVPASMSKVLADEYATLGWFTSTYTSEFSETGALVFLGVEHQSCLDYDKPKTARSCVFIGSMREPHLGYDLDIAQDTALFVVASKIQDNQEAISAAMSQSELANHSDELK